MSAPTAAELDEIRAAKHDGEGWAMRSELSEPLRESLASKGLIRLSAGRWQLTPIGFTYTLGF